MNIQEELARNARRMDRAARVAYKKAKKERKKRPARTIKPKKMDRYIYCLLLEGDRYYIGQTTNVMRRFNKHLSGKGADWTSLYKPMSILEYQLYKKVTESYCVDLEDDKTFEYTDKYGYSRVRGGRYCKVSSFF